MSANQNWKTRILVTSGVIGALLGLLAGFLYVRVAEESGGPRQVTTGDVVKLALGTLAVVRQASQLGS